MELLSFTHWASEYISKKGWNVPVLICQGGYVRIGIEVPDFPRLKTYDDYQIDSIISADTIDKENKLKILVKVNLDRLYLSLKALHRQEEMKDEVRKQLGY